MNTKMGTLWFVLLSLSLSLARPSFAAEVTVSVHPELEKLANPPAVYYRYESATKNEIAENAAKLFDRLNSQGLAALDKDLLVHAADREVLRIRTAEADFYALGPDSLGFVFSRDLARYLQPADAHGAVVAKRLPDTIVATQMARSYLSKLDLLPGDASEIEVTKVHAVQTANVSAGFPFVQAADQMVVVFFGRRLGGLPVFGASRMVVRLGDGGELVSIIRNWPKLVPVAVDGAAAMFGRSQWKDAAVRTVKGRETGDIYPNASIDSMQVVMYDDGRGRIEPALRAQGRRFDKRGNASERTWMVPIMRDPKGRY
ncbi:MAG: hypothetical protein JXQ73_26125 [Phycisphaerae bacterium]|nr:hypothetical protein [Phycisphaerae bacterium]